MPVSNEYLIAKFGFDTAENEPDLLFLICLPPRDLMFPHVAHPHLRAVERAPARRPGLHGRERQVRGVLEVAVHLRCSFAKLRLRIGGE